MTNPIALANLGLASANDVASNIKYISAGNYNKTPFESLT